MKPNTKTLIAIAVAIFLLWQCGCLSLSNESGGNGKDGKDGGCKDGKCPLPVKPDPRPLVPPRPKPKPCPSDDEPDSSAGGRPQLGGLTSPDGTVSALDLPESEKKRNVGGRDGAGLCVFTSIEYCARWQNERKLVDFQSFMRREPGGGYPEKVDAMINKYAKGVNYIQDTSGDYELLKLAIATGRMVGVTWNGHDPHYSGSIAHMVTLAYAGDQWAAITDNNYPGDDELVWCSPEEFMKRFGGREGWSVILLNPGPPPVPKNP